MLGWFEKRPNNVHSAEFTKCENAYVFPLCSLDLLRSKFSTVMISAKAAEEENDKKFE